MDVRIQEIIIALIAVIPGTIALIKQYRSDRSSIRATDADTIAKYIKMTDELTNEVARLRKEILDLHRELGKKDTIVDATNLKLSRVVEAIIKNIVNRRLLVPPDIAARWIKPDEELITEVEVILGTKLEIEKKVKE